MSLLDRALIRAAVPKAGLGMVLANQFPGGNKAGPKAGTAAVTYNSPGQPQWTDWDATLSIRNAYLGHAWVMRCLRTIADTLAGLDFRAGMNPETPEDFDPGATLVRLLGRATPQAPGGPNATTTSRALWAWSCVQYLATGRMSWEQQLDPVTKNVTALWPLVSASLLPIPSQAGSQRWFDGFIYQTPTGTIKLKPEQVFYAWRPSAEDWRQPESCLKAASMPISVAVAVDRYMWGLLRNNMVAAKMVITPPFDEAELRRSFADSFLAEFSGYDNAGKTIFVEAEQDEDGQGGKGPYPEIQIVDLATKNIDAQLLEVVQQAKVDITIATGVPESLIGNAANRIYANADAEYRNFWTITMLAIISELEDAVNVNLAPLLGDEVGWFDLSNVVALQPPQVFTPPDVKDMIDEGVISPQDAATILNLPAFETSGEDVYTAPLGEESPVPNQIGGRSVFEQAMRRRMRLQAPSFARAVQLAPNAWLEYRGLNTSMLRAGKSPWKLEMRRERVELGQLRTHPIASEIESEVARLRSRRLARCKATYQRGALTDGFDSWFAANSEWLETQVCA